jgi:hypothetical protein
MSERRYTYRCEDCGQQIPCHACGKHYCCDECPNCGGGCWCDCSCPTLREDAWY